MVQSTQSSVLDDVEDVGLGDGSNGFHTPGPLFERPSRARSRNNAIAAHQKRRRVAKSAVNLVVILQHKQGGCVRDKREFELLRDRASRLIGESGQFSLRQDLDRALTQKAKKGLSRVS